MATTVTAQAPRVTDAWSVTRGINVVLAVVDHDIDVLDHPDFEGRVLSGLKPSGAHRPRTMTAHGTRVAGLSLARGARLMGLAPEAGLLPVAISGLVAGVGTPEEAHALRWAADHAADVICCAWAPPNPDAESGQLPGHTRDAIDYCLTHGRAGKGCVVVFSAGNDGNDLALNGYASHPGVIAVGACNCHGRHPSYSGRGDALWCVFPSNDPRDPVGASMTYLTTAPAGSLLDGEAYYTTRFGFTSAACAAVAGICALIVSANPDLTSQQVKQVLRDACDRIDVGSGTYDEHGHSPLYGYGRPDVARAVRLAQSARSTPAPHREKARPTSV